MNNQDSQGKESQTSSQQIRNSIQGYERTPSQDFSKEDLYSIIQQNHKTSKKQDSSSRIVVSVLIIVIAAAIIGLVIFKPWERSNTQSQPVATVSDGTINGGINKSNAIPDLSGYWIAENDAGMGAEISGDTILYLLDRG